MDRRNGFPLDPLVKVMDRLLGPGGCPWDREQTHASLRPHAVEEAYEVVGAIDDGDFAALRDELGDLLLQVVFHAALAQREGHFDLNDVIEAITAKLVRRHPHVFGRSEARDPDAVLRQWDMIKHRETTSGETGRPPLFDHQPALILAQKLLGRAERLGFKRPGPLAPGAGGPKAAEAELGESLLALVEQARRQGIEAELALRQACARMARTLDRAPRGE